MKILTLVAVASLALAGCTSVVKNNVLMAHALAGGLHAASVPSPDLAAGYGQTDVHSVPLFDSKGNPLKYVGRCGTQNGPHTYALLSGNASATVSQANGVGSAIAANRLSATGDTADLVALGGGQAPSPAAITALNDCSKAGAPAPAG